MNGIVAAPNAAESQNDSRDSLTLEGAIDRAVSQSLLQVDKLQGGVDEAFLELDSVVDRAKQALGSNESSVGVIDSYQSEIQQARDEAIDLFRRQRGVLGTVNIALFGRTGAGKSSLIEALVRGDGSTISTGESDFTTEVRGVTWRGCRVIDTPGTQGWGRSERRDILEARARQAVEVADIVLLCFDTQSQQEGEFQKVGSWVKEYGKPAIAILNSKNQKWRRPDKVSLGSARRTLSEPIRQHASNIDTELARLGIFGVPIIAISAQRAAYARVDGAYRGPAIAQFNKLRSELGADVLLQWSNLEVLEEVIADALTHQAAELRLGMLHAQIRALFDRLNRELSRADGEVKSAATALDGTIEGLFAVIGYPMMGTAARDILPKNPQGQDLLSCVEKVRGGAYDGKAEGKFARFARQRLNARLGRLRSKSLKEADEFVVRAFEQRRDMNSEEFSQAVFDPAKIQSVCEGVLSEAVKFVERETRLVIDDARLDLEFAYGQTAVVKGSAGTTRRKVGYGVNVAGVLSGLATVGTGLYYAALVDPEPVTKVLFTIAAVATSLASMVLGWFGGKQRKKAEEARQGAWAEANASMRRQVNDTYDGITTQVSETAASVGCQAMLRLLKEPLLRAGALWVLSEEGGAAMVRLGQLRDTLPEHADPQQVLITASKHVGSRRSPSEKKSVEWVLLGEDWIVDPIGLLADEGTSDLVRTRIYDPGLFSRLFDGLRGFIDRFGESVQRESGGQWLAETEGLLAQDSEAVSALAELRAIQQRGVARLQLFGDYSSGKTSFAKRLLIDAGLPLPPSLEVRADPTTDKIHVYEWEGFDLVDTPGLQSTTDSHANAAMDAYPDASAIIYLLPPNLLVGSTADLEQLLKGDPERGLVSKRERTIFVIHRADELGPNPEEVPEEYVRLCERKKEELKQALASRGVTIDTDRVFCMAADPFHMVGNRRDVNAEQFDPYRTWDGFVEFRKAIREINVRFHGAGLDCSLLEGGLARLGRLDAAVIARQEEVMRRQGALRRLGAVLAEIVAEGERIEGELRARVRSVVDDHAYSYLDRVVGAANDAELLAAGKQLEKWWGLSAFESDAARWQNEAGEAINGWFKRSTDQINRVVDTPRFKHAVASGSARFDSEALGNSEHGWVGRVLNLIAQPLKGATRDVVYWVGKSVGATFRPWGAVNLARTLAKVGVVLSAVAVVVDSVMLVAAWKNEKRRAEHRQKMREFVEKSSAEVLKSLTEGDDETAGPMIYLKTIQSYLSGISADLSAELTVLGSDMADFAAKRGRYKTCMDQAWTLIGFKGTEA